MTRVFLDANILFSASLDPASPMAGLISTSKALGIQCLCSPLVLEEAVRNLKKKRPAGLKHLPLLLAKIEMVPGSSSTNCPVPLPDKDKPVLLAAMAGRADVLITGDHKDFGPYMNKPRQTGGVLIQTFVQFIDAELKLK